MGNADDWRAELNSAAIKLRAMGEAALAVDHPYILTRGTAARMVAMAEAWRDLDASCLEGYLPDPWWDSRAQDETPVIERRTEDVAVAEDRL